MTEQDLNYVISVLKEEQSAYVPEWYSVLGFLYCHRIAGLFYKRAQSGGKAAKKNRENFKGNIRETKTESNFYETVSFLSHGNII